MVELATLTLQDLRSMAQRLAVPGAERLSRGTLLHILSSRVDEWASWDLSPTEGALIVRERPDAMERRDDGQEPTPARGLQPLGSASGAGRTAPVASAPPLNIPDLPWAYEDDRLVLLIRDPRTVYAYWDCHPETVRNAFAALPDAWPFLRVLMLGGSEPRVVCDVSVELSAKSWYVHELEPHRDYRVELILKAASGAERLLLRPSNVVTLPPNAPSAWIEDRFASIPLEIALPDAAVFLTGRRMSDFAGRMHGRAYELSLGPTVITGDSASSAQGIREGFGGRSWSGTLVKK